MLDKILDILGQEGVAAAILSGVAIVFGWFMKRAAVKEYDMGRCVLALQSAVQEVYETYVKGLKEGAADGKLTDAEKQEARDRAYNQARDILKTEGIELAKYYGPRIAKGLIERFIKKSKTEGKEAKTA